MKNYDPRNVRLTIDGVARALAFDSLVFHIPAREACITPTTIWFEGQLEPRAAEWLRLTNPYYRAKRIPRRMKKRIRKLERR